MVNEAGWAITIAFIRTDIILQFFIVVKLPLTNMDEKI